MAEYCKPSVRRVPLISSFVSISGFDGDLAVSWMDVMGKVDGLGFPASNEMTPGVNSNGNRPRTVGRLSQSGARVKMDITH